MIAAVGTLGTGSSPMTVVKIIGLVASALIAVGSIASDACGEAAQDFYRNKQVRLIVGHPVGNDHDVGGRLLARYLGKHIPGRPSVIVQNMTAAASVAAANYVYGQAPRDGTVMGTFSRNFPSQAMMGQPNVEADPRRFQWLGATSFPGRVCTAWATAAVKTPTDLFSSELIVGGSGAASTLSIVFRVEEAALPDRPDVPTIFAEAKTDEQRQLMRFVFSSVEFGRPYVFPPDVPRERVEIMRKAIDAAARDPELIAEAEKMKLDMAYRPPEHLERLIANLYRTSPAIVEAVKKLVPNLD